MNEFHTIGISAGRSGSSVTVSKALWRTIKDLVNESKPSFSQLSITRAERLRAAVDSASGDLQGHGDDEVGVLLDDLSEVVVRA